MKSLKLIHSLVTTDWLQKNLEHPDIVILDASMQNPITSPEKILEAPQDQIPASRYFDIKKVFSDTKSGLPNTVPSAKKFEEEAQKLGINNSSCIIVYDRSGIYSSPRVWWLFRAMGHHNIAVLDGGLPYWLALGLPTKPILTTNWKKGNFKAIYNPTMTINIAQVLKASNDQNSCILDARSPDRFDGSKAEPRPGMRSGHIPNSQNLHYQQVLKNGKMRPKNELKVIFTSLEISKKQLIFSCGSGITACILALAANISEYNEGLLYDGSWSEWGSSDLPMATKN